MRLLLSDIRRSVFDARRNRSVWICDYGEYCDSAVFRCDFHAVGDVHSICQYPWIYGRCTNEIALVLSDQSGITVCSVHDLSITDWYTRDHIMLGWTECVSDARRSFTLLVLWQCRTGDDGTQSVVVVENDSYDSVYPRIYRQTQIQTDTNTSRWRESVSQTETDCT